MEDNEAELQELRRHVNEFAWKPGDMRSPVNIPLRKHMSSDPDEKHRRLYRQWLDATTAGDLPDLHAVAHGLLDAGTEAVSPAGDPVEDAVAEIMAGMAEVDTPLYRQHVRSVLERWMRRYT